MADRLQIASRHRRILQALLREHLPGVEVWAYGSRVNGRGHDGSDLDLVLRAPDLQKLPASQLLDFEDAIRASNIPFLVEAQDWACLPERFHQEIEWDYVVVSDGSERARGPATLPVGTTHPRGLPPVDSIHWPLVPAHEVFKLTYGRALAARDRRPGNVPVYGTNGRCGTHDSALFDGPGVILGRKGQGPLGVEWSGGPYWVIDTAYTLTPLRQNVHLKFAYYLLKFIGLNHLKDGTSNPTLSRDTFGAQALPLPPVATQRTIAHILGTLDNKIELNRRMNTTLEAIARALFRSWFVDFDPVRAKMEGRDTGLPKDIADLFPNRLVDSEVGMIPLGWPVGILADHFEAVKGVSYKGSGLGTDGEPLHNLNSIHEGGGYKYEGIKFYSGEYAERHCVRPGDVIVANTEQGHDRLLIGYAAIVPGLFGADGIVSHHIYRLRPRSASWLSTRFLFFLLNSAQMHDLVSGYANGTTVNMLPIDGVQRPPFVVPPRALVEAFDVVASSSEHRREQAVCESRTLTVVREVLLPKLISGEMRVRDAEKLVGAIA